MQDGPIGIIMIKTPRSTYSNLVDAQVRIHANAAPTMNADGQMIGVHLQAPNLSTLQVIEPAPSDPFASPSYPDRQVIVREHYTTPIHRIHLRGNVTLQWPGTLLCIRDADTRNLRADKSGYPRRRGRSGRCGRIRGDRNNVPSSPMRSSEAQEKLALFHPNRRPPTKILRGGSGSELIQIDGQLIGYDLASSEATLQLSSGDTLFPAILPKSLAGNELAPGESGAGCASPGSARSASISRTMYAPAWQ